jgi:putative membrane-bound dehydrogenase-like protein
MRRKPNCFLRHLVVFLLLIPGLLTEPKLFAQEIYDSQKETIPKMKPEEVVQTTKLPEGFTITAIASEPDVQQPIAMTWDALGRLWIAENYTYAESALRVDKNLSDRIVILQDADNDGVFEKRKVFAEGLKGLTSIEIHPSGKGVLALAPPYLYMIPDTNADDIADSPPSILLRGFNEDIRHNFANGLRFGPDGWLYGRHGILGISAVNKSPTKGNERQDSQPTLLTCGIWRFNLLNQRLEMVCEGTTNPWGMDWDDHGNLFFINTVIGHLWQAIPNAHLQRMYGADSDPYAYELLPQIADHVHWDSSAEDWRETRKGPPSSGTDSAGGGHAHSGLMIYQADQWPEEYRGNVFALNLHGRRINRDFLKPSGASFVASHGQDMVYWQDPWFRGLDISQAPDGSAVVIDWSDIGECHDDDGVHRTSGRIYRISYKNDAQTPYQEQMKILQKIYYANGKGDKPVITGKEVVSILSHPNSWFTHQFLKMRGLSSGVEFKELEPVYELAMKAPKNFRSAETRFEVTKQVRALWALGNLHTDKLISLLRSDQHESIHCWAARKLFDAVNPSDLRAIARDNQEYMSAVEAEILDCLYAQSKPHASAQFRLVLASRLPLMTHEFDPMLTQLLESDDLANDLTFNLMLWYGIKDQVPERPLELAKMMQSTQLDKLQELVLRRLSAIIVEKGKNSDLAHQGLSFFFADAVQRDLPKLHAACIRGLWGTYQGRSQVAKPPYWDELAALGAKHPDVTIQRLCVLLGSVFDPNKDIQPLVRIVEDKSIPIAERKAAIEALGGIDDPEVIDRLKRFFDDQDLGNSAAYALRRTLNKSRAEQMVDLFAQVPDPTRRGIISALASRVDTMEVLLDAIDNNKIAKESVDASSWRQFASANNWQLLERARKHTKVLDIQGNRKELIEKEEALLTPDLIAKGNVNSGRGIWISKCGNCHKLYGQGGQIGPELTGAQRSNIRYWLENILAPSEFVAENYRSTAFRTLDGRVITGVVLSETANEVTIQTAQEKIILNISEIEERNPLQLSLMPEGLLEGLSEDSKLNLFKYLTSSPQELSK